MDQATMSPNLGIRTLSTVLATQLRNAILGGEYAPGTWLKQDVLAARFKVSRMPVREALRQLETEGLVELFPHRGAMVAELSPEEITELFELRSVLETMAFALATERITTPDLDRLEQIIEKMESGVVDNDRWLQLNREFHQIICSACGRKQLNRLVESLRANVDRYLRLYVSLLAGSNVANIDHRQILAALKTKDAELVRQLTKQHLMNTNQHLIKFLESVSDTPKTVEHS